MSTATRRRYAKRMEPSARRQQLLDVTLKLVSENGFEGLTMEAVAQAAGVTKPVVYDYFANSAELGAALLEREEERALRSIAEAFPFLEGPESIHPDSLFPEIATGFMRAAGELSAEELIATAAEAWLQAVVAHPDTWRLILMPPEGAPSTLREHVEDAHESGLAAMTLVIPWLLRERGGAEKIDPELLAHSTQAFSLRAAQLVLTEPESFTPERVGEFTRQLLALLPPVKS